MSLQFEKMWLFCVILCACGAAAHQNSLSGLSEQPPNILFVVMDDLGSNDLGLHGSGIQTPQADELALQGVYLENSYVLPYCSSTRASILSGRYPLHTGCHAIIEDSMTQGLPLDEETLPQALQRAGYQTHAVGKWHIGHSRWQQTPTFRGFQSFYGFYHGHQDYYTHIKTGGSVGDAYEMHNDSGEFCGAGCSKVVDERGNYSTNVFTREALRVIHSHDATSGPLFLYLAHQAVHWPDEVPSNYKAIYANRTDWSERRITYAAMLTAADESLRNVTLALQAKGMWNNTLVVYTTDNGGPTSVCMVQGSSNYPRRGGKCTVFEGGTRGDAFLSGPALKSKRKGTRYEHLFHAVDWLPTLATLAGVKPAGKPLDGVSQWEALQQSHRGIYTSPPRQEIFIGYAAYKDRWYGPAIRWQNWKLIQGVSGGPETPQDYPFGPRTPAHGGIPGPYMLYNLELDQGEHHDVSSEFPEVVLFLRARLIDYQRSYVAPIDDDPTCPFNGLPDMNGFGPTWMPWCQGASEVRVYQL